MPLLLVGRIVGGVSVRARPGRLSVLSVLHSKSVCVALLYGRAGRSTARNGGFRPGQTSLLFVAFESWMVAEHRRLQLPLGWLARTHSACAVCSGASAIVAGFAAQVASRGRWPF